MARKFNAGYYFSEGFHSIFTHGFMSFAAIGITNQRETTILWEKATGRPIYNAIVWQDRRTAQMAGEISRTHGDMIRQKTGLIVDAYFSATKIKWIIDNVEGVKEKIEKGRIIAGTLDTWMIWKLQTLDETNFA